MNIVVMAGGYGTRLWPLSRAQTPKQLLPLTSDRPMIVDCLERVIPLVGKNHVYISCVTELLPALRRVLPDFDERRLIIEPVRRDSGPSMAYAASVLARHGAGDEPMAFVPTDHAISDDELFRLTLKAGLDLVAGQGGFADIGIVATSPLTTVGYTRVGPMKKQENGIAYAEFLGHVEKPAADVAAKLVASGDYLWHANYYMGTPNRFLEAFREHAPAVYEMAMAAKEDHPSWPTLYESLPRISIDHAVTEKLPAGSMSILRGEFGWSDVGLFSQLRDWVGRANNGKENVGTGRARHIDSSGCLVISRPDKMVATIGVSDLAIIDTGDALLVCDLSRSGEVKQLVEILKDNEDRDLL